MTQTFKSWTRGEMWDGGVGLKPTGVSKYYARGEGLDQASSPLPPTPPPPHVHPPNNGQHYSRSHIGDWYMAGVAARLMSTPPVVDMGKHGPPPRLSSYWAAHSNIGSDWSSHPMTQQSSTPPVPVVDYQLIRGKYVSYEVPPSVGIAAVVNTPAAPLDWPMQAGLKRRQLDDYQWPGILAYVTRPLVSFDWTTAVGVNRPRLDYDQNTSILAYVAKPVPPVDWWRYGIDLPDINELILYQLSAPTVAASPVTPSVDEHFKRFTPVYSFEASNVALMTRTLVQGVDGLVMYSKGMPFALLSKADPDTPPRSFTVVLVSGPMSTTLRSD